jgi:uncharacterized SAM-binding protein YcdF (DUF218 family)
MWWRWLLYILALGLCLWGAAFAGSGFILGGPAAAPVAAELIVVLGGDTGARYQRARAVWTEGYAPRLLLINAPTANVRDARALLPQLPEAATVLTDNQPGNSWQEAEAVRALMLAEGWRRVLVVSDPPHMLRLAYVWSAVLRGTGLEYTLVASEPAWWAAGRWWADPRARSFVASEWVKLGYYLAHYRFGWVGEPA